MRKLRKLQQVIRSEGVGEGVDRSIEFIFNQCPDSFLRPFTIYALMRDGRSLQDVRYLLDNNRDRHDALSGPDRFYSSSIYPSPETRSQHYYRYVFAANLISKTKFDRVMDIAAGLGYGSYIIKTKLSSEFDYIACDISSNSLRYGQKHYSPEESVQSDAQKLPFESNSIDIVLSFETMEHIPSVEDYLGELNRVSQPDANLFFSIPYDEDLNLDEEHKRKDYPHIHTFRYNEFKKVLSIHFPERRMTIYGQEKTANIRSVEMVDGLPPGFTELNSQNEISNQGTLLAHIHQ